MAGIPYLSASYSAAAGASLTPSVAITTSIANGDSIDVGILATAGTVVGLSDSQGNSYTLVQSETTTAGCQVYTFACPSANPLTAGTDTYLPQWSSASSVQGLIAVGDNNVNPNGPGSAGQDKAVGATATSGTSASVATGTLSYAEEHIIGFVVNLAAGGVPVISGGPAALTHVEGGVVAYLTAFTEVVNATTSVTPVGTITSTTWAISVVTNEVAPVAVSTVVSDGVQGIPYSQTLEASGGVTPYTWSVTSGALPTGLTLGSGVISGTPTVNGTFSFTLTATDAHAITNASPQTLVLLPSGAGGAPAQSLYNNRLTAADSDFEVAGFTWAALANATAPARTSSTSLTGSECLYWASAADGDSSIQTAQYTGIQPGTGYIASAFIQPGGPRNVFIGFNWYTSSGTLISSSESAGVNGNANPLQWQPVTIAATAPATAAKATVFVLSSGTNKGEVTCVDLAYFTQAGCQVLVDWVNPPYAPGGVAGQAFMDISSWVRQDIGATITHGRQDAISEIQPGSASFQIQNDTGVFSEVNAAGIPALIGGDVTLQGRCQVNLTDENGVWHTRFDGPLQEIDYSGDNTGDTNIAQVTAMDVLAYLNREDPFLCWTAEQILFDGPQWHWTLNDAGNTGASGMAAETSGNNGPSMRVWCSEGDHPPTATITWQDTRGGIETLADAVAVGKPDGSEYWAAGSNQPASPTRGLDSGVAGPFTTPLGSVYLVPKIQASTRNYFTSQVGYELSATVPEFGTGDNQNYAYECFFTVDPYLYNNPTVGVGPFVQLSIGSSRTQSCIVAGVFESGGTAMTYQVDNYNDAPAFLGLNWPGTAPPAAVSSLSTAFTPDTTHLPHHLVINITGSTASGATVTAYLDNQMVGSSFTLPAGQVFDTVVVGAAFGHTGCHYGGIQLVSQYNYNLSPQQIALHCQLGQYGMWESTTDDCIAQVANYASIPGFWNNLSAQHSGLTLTDYQDITGSNGVSAMQLFEQAEMGLLYVNNSGQLSFQTRDWRMGHGAPDLYLPPDTFDADGGFNLVDQFMCNEQAVSSQLFSTGAGYVNTASQQQYGSYATNGIGSPSQIPLISWSRAYGTLGLPSFYYWTDPSMADYAAWRANSYSSPWLCPGQLTVDIMHPESGTPNVSAYYALDISSMVAPSGTLPQSWPTGNLSSEWFIEGITETYSLTTRTLQFYNSPAETQRAWIPGDATYGVLGSTTRIGVSQADTSQVQADGKDVAHDAGRPYWPPTFSSTMNNPSANSHAFIGAADLRGIADCLSLVLNPPLASVGAKTKTQSQTSGAYATPQIYYDAVYADSAGGMGAVPGWPNWYVCLVPGWYDIDGQVVWAGSETAGNFGQGWIVVAQAAAQGVAQNAGVTPIAAGRYVCPVGEASRFNGSNENCISVATTRMYLGLGDMVTLAAQDNSTFSTGTGVGGSGLSLVFRALGRTDDRCNLNSSIASGGTVLQPSPTGTATAVYHNTHTYCYYGSQPGGWRAHAKQNTDGNMYQGAPPGGLSTYGTQYGQVRFYGSGIGALAGLQIVSATLTCQCIYSYYSTGVNLMVGAYFDPSGVTPWIPSHNTKNISNAVQQTFKQGQTLTFNIPTQLVSDLAQVSGALGLYIGNDLFEGKDFYGTWKGGANQWKLTVTYVP